MKTFGISALVLASALLVAPSTAGKPEACTKSCSRWGVSSDCKDNCPPCRTKAPSGATEYQCWDYEYGTNKCPPWSDIIDCGASEGGATESSAKAAPEFVGLNVESSGNNDKPVVTPAPPASSPSPAEDASPSYFSTFQSAAGRNGLTIFNNCGNDFTVMMDNKPVPEHCLNGQFCNEYYGSNPAFYVRRSNDHIELGRTLVELNIPHGQRVWYDISKITGFNVGAEVKYVSGSEERHHIVCNTVNCADAYWLCDIAVDNKFHPVYDGPAGGAFVISFCPRRPDSIPDTKKGVERFQSDPSQAPFTCRVKLFKKDLSLPGTIVDGGAI